MGLLTDKEKAQAWKRLHAPHPFGSSAQLCHMSANWTATTAIASELGLHKLAGKTETLKRLVDRRVVITSTSARRIITEVMK